MDSACFDTLSIIEEGEIEDDLSMPSPGPALIAPEPPASQPRASQPPTSFSKPLSVKRKRRDDGLPKEKGKFPKLEDRLTIQKNREQNLNRNDPKFVEYLKYSFKFEYNNWVLDRPLYLRNTKTNVVLPIPPAKLDSIDLNENSFSLTPTANQFRIKDCHFQHEKFSIYLKNLDKYIQVPYESITAFPNGYDPQLNITHTKSTENISSNDAELRQELWQQIMENDCLNEKFRAATQMAEQSHEKNKNLLETNSDLIEKLQAVQKEYDSLKKENEKLSREKHEEKRYKDNYKKWNETLSSDNARMQNIKADLKHLQRLQVEIDIQRAEAIQMISALDKKTHEKLKKSLKQLIEKADYEQQMKYAKSSILNVGRGSVGNRLKRTYFPTGDGGFSEDAAWKKKYSALPWPVSEEIQNKLTKK